MESWNSFFFGVFVMFLILGGFMIVNEYHPIIQKTVGVNYQRPYSYNAATLRPGEIGIKNTSSQAGYFTVRMPVYYGVSTSSSDNDTTGSAGIELSFLKEKTLEKTKYIPPAESKTFTFEPSEIENFSSWGHWEVSPPNKTVAKKKTVKFSIFDYLT